jgi:hypothetical protein
MSVLATCASDGDAAGAGGQVGVVGEVADQLAGAGGVQDDVLDAGVEAVEVEDVAEAAAGSRSRSRTSSMRSACGGTERPSVSSGRWR